MSASKPSLAASFVGQRTPCRPRCLAQVPCRGVVCVPHATCRICHSTARLDVGARVCLALTCEGKLWHRLRVGIHAKAGGAGLRKAAMMLAGTRAEASQCAAPVRELQHCRQTALCRARVASRGTSESGSVSAHGARESRPWPAKCRRTGKRRGGRLKPGLRCARQQHLAQVCGSGKQTLRQRMRRRAE